MNQPELGIKVAELRKLRGFTQEQLAEKCEVNTRTIQRIETGDVDPRTYTLQCLSRELGFDFSQDYDQNVSLWLAVLHLSSILPLLFVPLLIWSWKRKQSLKIDRQGRKVLNFQISMLLLLFVGGFLLMIFTGSLPIIGAALEQAGFNMALFDLVIICAALPMTLIGLLCFYAGVVNLIRSVTDRPVHYPLSIPFIRNGSS